MRKCFEMGFNKLKSCFFHKLFSILIIYSNICIDRFFCYTKQKLHSKCQHLHRQCMILRYKSRYYSESARNFAWLSDKIMMPSEIFRDNYHLCSLRGCYSILVNEIFTLSWWASERFLQIARDRNQPSRRP